MKSKKDQRNKVERETFDPVAFDNDGSYGYRNVPDREDNDITDWDHTKSYGSTYHEDYLGQADEFLRRGDWVSADEYCDKELSVHPGNTQAYLRKLLADLRANDVTKLAYLSEPFDKNEYYQLILRSGDKKTIEQLQQYLTEIIDRIRNANSEETYSNAMRKMESGIIAKSVEELQEAKKQFDSISSYKDAKKQSKRCQREIDILLGNKKPLIFGIVIAALVIGIAVMTIIILNNNGVFDHHPETTSSDSAGTAGYDASSVSQSNTDDPLSITSEDSTTAPSENMAASNTTEPPTAQTTTTTTVATTTTTQQTTEPTTKKPPETTTQRPPTQPTTVTLTSVVDQSQSSAESKLQSAGFKVQIQYEESVDYDPGTVIRQTPKAGTTVEKNSTVTIVVSTSKTITVTFDANGGSVNTSKKDYAYNNYYSDLPTPSRDYYSFDGWFTSASGGSKVNTSTRISSKSNHTLYAHWTQNKPDDWTTDTSKLNDSSYKSESKTQYRYRDKQTTTSTSSSKSGWTQDGYFTEATGSGSVDYVASWPPGFDRSNSLYSKYNQSVSDTDTRKYSSPSTIGYIYWHWVWSGCKGAKPYNCFIVDTYGEVPHPNYGAATVFEAIVLDSPLSYNSGAAAFECQNRSEYSFWWLGWDEESSTQLPILRSSYTDYQKVYNYYKWGDWSSWSDSFESGSSTREVETRTMYRYTKK